MLTSQDPGPRRFASRQARTVTLRRARIVIAASAACALICLAAVLLSLVTSGLTAALIPGLAGFVLMTARARRWHRAVRRALVSPDAMHWSPES